MRTSQVYGQIFKSLRLFVCFVPRDVCLLVRKLNRNNERAILSSGVENSSPYLHATARIELGQKKGQLPMNGVWRVFVLRELLLRSVCCYSARAVLSVDGPCPVVVRCKAGRDD